MSKELKKNRRILVIDDNRTIHDDVRKILGTKQANAAGLDQAEASLFGTSANNSTDGFEIDSAYQGQEGLELVRQALRDGRPYAIAFVDIRMPPGWDGITTIAHLWKEDPNIEMVVCTAYADYTWEDMTATLGETDHLLILKKPFDNIEVRQLACALCAKWNLACQVRHTVDNLERAVAERTVELQQQQEQLQESYSKTRQLLEAVSSVLIGMDGNGRVTSWNGAATRMFDIEAGDASGRLFDDLEIGWDRGAMAGSVSQCLTKNVPIRQDEVRFKKPDGTDGFLDITFSPVNNASGSSCGYLLIAQDITGQKILQGQLTQAQKLESIGQLAAGIAHEINTPTQYVGDNIRFFQDSVQDLIRIVDQYAGLLDLEGEPLSWDARTAEIKAALENLDVAFLKEEIPKAIEQSLEGVERVAKIVRSMKEFSHPGGTDKQAVDLNKAIESTITVARNEWKYVAEMVTDFDPALPPVPCLAGEFNQAILNIVINATHTIADVVGKNTGEKGTITISTRLNRGWAEIRISDTGTGIPEAYRSKVFDHFFTAKEVGKGTGQGLAIAYAVIVDKHGGTITFETEIGKGTTFIINLPTEVDAPAAEETPQHEDAYSLR